MVGNEVAPVERLSDDLRRAMVDNQVRTFDVTDQRVLEAFYETPRERFLPAALASLAYSDAQITLKASDAGRDNRVLMPPLFLAKLLQTATLTGGEKVLIVGCAMGYSAALVSRLATSVVALDSDAAFTDVARRNLRAAGAANVSVETGPMPDGRPGEGPYEVILVDGAVECNLDRLFAQLAPGGRLVTIEAKSATATRRSCKAMRFDHVSGEISGRAVFDATVPVLAEFRDKPAFVF